MAAVTRIQMITKWEKQGRNLCGFWTCVNGANGRFIHYRVIQAPLTLTRRTQKSVPFLLRNFRLFSSVVHPEDLTEKTTMHTNKPVDIAPQTDGDISTQARTVSAMLRHWEVILELANIPEPRASVEHVLAHILGSKQVSTVYDEADRELDAEQLKQLDRLCQCRLVRMPVQYIIGEWDFCDVTLKLRPPVFIPRPETEGLVKLTLQHLQPGKKVLEIGCGSGALSLALLKSCPGISITAVDQSQLACDLTQENASALGLDQDLQVMKTKVTEKGITGVKTQKFDVIVSNPPYVPQRDLLQLEPEITVYEDLRALNGGRDGLDVIKLVLNFAAAWLLPGGKLLMEVDPSHPKLLQSLLHKEELILQYICSHKDFAGKERYVEFCTPLSK